MTVLIVPSLTIDRTPKFFKVLAKFFIISLSYLSFYLFLFSLFPSFLGVVNTCDFLCVSLKYFVAIMLGQLLLQMLSWSEDNTKALVRFFGTAHQRYVSVLYFYSSPVIFLDRHARITQRSFDSKLNQSFKSRLFFPRTVESAGLCM